MCEITLAFDWSIDDRNKPAGFDNALEQIVHVMLRARYIHHIGFRGVCRSLPLNLARHQTNGNVPQDSVSIN